MRRLPWLCLVVLCLAACDREVALALGDDGGTDAAPGDAASGADGAQPVDLAGAPPLCSLGNDPLPCSDDATCVPYGAHCAQPGPSGQCACDTQACTPGADQTCNSDPAMQSLLGHCNNAGVCECGTSSTRDPATGKCVFHPCPTSAPAGATACDVEGQQCSYLPNTTCVCATNSGMVGSMPQWNCAL